VVTSTLKSDTEHSQLLGIVNCTDYGTPQRISYKVQATNYHECAKSCSRGTKMLEGNKICDTTLELIFNGVLPHKCDASYNNNYSEYITCPSSTYEMDILICDFAIEEALHKFVLAHPMPPFLGCCSFSPSVFISLSFLFHNGEGQHI